MADGPITSPTNTRVKRLVRLRRRRARDEAGLFIIEGEREIERALAGGVQITELYVCEDLRGGLGPDLARRAKAAGAQRVDLGGRAFAKASYRDHPDGLLAVACQFSTGLDRLQIGDNPLLLVVEAIEKPGNLGTMLRTADAAGADGVVVCDPVTDPFNPNVVRASMGALFTVPLAVTTSDACLRWLAEGDIAAFATTPAGELPYAEADLRGPAAIVIGSEAEGLSPRWLESSMAIRLPMAGAVDSLNAAAVAAIVLYEAVRQRASPPLQRPVP